MTPTITWTGTLTAASSIAHGGDTRGTITLLRRERVMTEAGDFVFIPIISGNTLRGRLRRIGEELLRDAVGYEGQLPAPAAHALRGGGALAKSSTEPLSGSRLQRVRALVPQLGVFGAAAGGTIIGGALDVGKVVPHLAETTRITGAPSKVSALDAVQLEAYTRQDEADAHDFAPVLDSDATVTFDADGTPHAHPGSNQMLFHIETFPAGTQFSTWLRLRRPSPLELAFATDVLDTFTTTGRLGGRVAIGHGQVHADLTPTPGLPADLPDWRAHVRTHREDILTALKDLA
ncbi:hypothetical protein ACQFYA_20810 [Promicromonospora sp. Marseille-Q5078]